ncbi:hypothetical protein SAMN06297468_0694 [Altererythrobacter xiamenensis]|uniref:Uncharacterized protein n=2 Tax=Altererythrobacter xiamenensis TaxID=1316679 RepID=A0A1Y6EIH3_9SPHN|nr:hypothetical protein SAMN06297468_0694 [Altererythrobacter xiamenensis]
MSGKQRSERGRPLAAFAVFIGAWLLLRLATWEPLLVPIEHASSLPEALLAEGRDPSPFPIREDRLSERQVEARQAPALTDRPLGRPSVSIDADWQKLPAALSNEMPLEPARPSVEPSVAVGHQLLWAAAMAHLPPPHRLNGEAVTPTRLPSRVAEQSRKRDRWSLDAWAFGREGSENVSSTVGRAPVYGASQAAAVLRYRLAPSNPRDPRAYVRAYRALVANGESEVAAGLSARPLARLPLRAHAELRATHYSSDTEVRPAAFVTTELDPIALPAGLRAEVYGQGGYVGGEGETAFADGQLHVLRGLGGFDLGVFDQGKVSLGGGAWAGAQKGSSRVDLGPSMRLDLSIGETPARLSVDWRERVAGDAQPDSGVAVTLSTRF